MNNVKWYVATYLLAGVPYALSGIMGCYGNTKFTSKDGSDEFAFVTVSISTIIMTALSWPVFLWFEAKRSYRVHSSR